MTHPAHWLLLDGMLAVLAAWIVIGLAGIAALRRLAFVARVLFPLGGLFGLALAALALAAVFGGPQVAVLVLGLPGLPFHLRLDGLAAFFLFVIGAVAAGVSAFAAGYFRKGEGTPPGLLCLEYHVFHGPRVCDKECRRLRLKTASLAPPFRESEPLLTFP